MYIFGGILLTLVLTFGVSLHCGIGHVPSEAMCIDTLFTSYVLSTPVTSTLFELVQMLPALALLILYLPGVHKGMSAALLNMTSDAKSRYTKRDKFDKEPV